MNKDMKEPVTIEIKEMTRIDQACILAHEEATRTGCSVCFNFNSCQLEVSAGDDLAAIQDEYYRQLGENHDEQRQAIPPWIEIRPGNLLPDEGQTCLYISAQDGINIGKYEGSGHFAAFWAFDSHDDATHWMPAPLYEHLLPQE